LTPGFRSKPDRRAEGRTHRFQLLDKLGDCVVEVHQLQLDVGEFDFPVRVQLAAAPRDFSEPVFGEVGSQWIFVSPSSFEGLDMLGDSSQDEVTAAHPGDPVRRLVQPDELRISCQRPAKTFVP
jgi:hypothetical protein